MARFLASRLAGTRIKKPKSPSPGRLVLTLVVRDEEDILEDFLSYHLNRGVDFILATDHRSKDGTPAILKRFERQRVVKVFTERTASFRQPVWVTRMARLAHDDYGAAWVLNSDADEFWWPGEKGDLKAALAEVEPELGVIRVPRQNFLPRDDERGGFADRMVYREVFPRNGIGEPLPPKVCHRGHSQIEVGAGSHQARAPGLRELRGPPPLEILHFPLRTFAQFEHKIVKSYRSTLSHPEAVSYGAVRRAFFERYRRGELRLCYDEHVLDAERIERGLRHGRLVCDRRLQRFLSASSSTRDSEDGLWEAHG